MAKDIQSRKFQLTLNNPQEHGLTQKAIIEATKKLATIDYFCLCDEIGTEGTYHTHLFLFSRAPIRFSTLKNVFPEAHIEKALGSCVDNRNYILKEGKWADTEKAETNLKETFYEEGMLPSERAEKEPDISKIIDLFDDGASINDVINEFPKYAMRIRELESLSEIRKQNQQVKMRDINVTYIYGDTHTGKTYSIYDKYEPDEICRVTNYHSNGLFDGYHGQKVLVFDEFHSQISLPNMLNYLDVYPVSLPARFHDRNALYSEVYILSNIPLDQQYSDEMLWDFKTWQAFERRIHNIYHQISPGQRVAIKEGGKRI